MRQGPAHRSHVPVPGQREHLQGTWPPPAQAVGTLHVQPEAVRCTSMQSPDVFSRGALPVMSRITLMMLRV